MLGSGRNNAGYQTLHDPLNASQQNYGSINAPHVAIPMPTDNIEISFTHQSNEDWVKNALKESDEELVTLPWSRETEFDANLGQSVQVKQGLNWRATLCNGIERRSLREGSEYFYTTPENKPLIKIFHSDNNNILPYNGAGKLEDFISRLRFARGATTEYLNHATHIPTEAKEEVNVILNNIYQNAYNRICDECALSEQDLRYNPIARDRIIAKASAIIKHASAEYVASLYNASTEQPNVNDMIQEIVAAEQALLADEPCQDNINVFCHQNQWFYHAQNWVDAQSNPQTKGAYHLIRGGSLNYGNHRNINLTTQYVDILDNEIFQTPHVFKEMTRTAFKKYVISTDKVLATTCTDEFINDVKKAFSQPKRTNIEPILTEVLKSYKAFHKTIAHVANKDDTKFYNVIKNHWPNKKRRRIINQLRDFLTLSHLEGHGNENIQKARTLCTLLLEFIQAQAIYLQESKARHLKYKHDLTACVAHSENLRDALTTQSHRQQVNDDEPTYQATTYTRTIDQTDVISGDLAFGRAMVSIINGVPPLISNNKDHDLVRGVVALLDEYSVLCEVQTQHTPGISSLAGEKTRYHNVASIKTAQDATRLLQGSISDIFSQLIQQGHYRIISLSENVALPHTVPDDTQHSGAMFADSIEGLHHIVDRFFDVQRQLAEENLEQETRDNLTRELQETKIRLSTELKSLSQLLLYIRIDSPLAPFYIAELDFIMPLEGFQQAVTTLNEILATLADTYADNGDYTALAAFADLSQAIDLTQHAAIQTTDNYRHIKEAYLATEKTLFKELVKVISQEMGKLLINEADINEDLIDTQAAQAPTAQNLNAIPTAIPDKSGFIEVSNPVADQAGFKIYRYQETVLVKAAIENEGLYGIFERGVRSAIVKDSQGTPHKVVGSVQVNFDTMEEQLDEFMAEYSAIIGMLQRWSFDKAEPHPYAAGLLITFLASSLLLPALGLEIGSTFTFALINYIFPTQQEIEQALDPVGQRAIKMMIKENDALMNVADDAARAHKHATLMSWANVAGYVTVAGMLIPIVLKLSELLLTRRYEEVASSAMVIYDRPWAKQDLPRVYLKRNTGEYFKLETQFVPDFLQHMDLPDTLDDTFANDGDVRQLTRPRGTELPRPRQERANYDRTITEPRIRHDLSRETIYSPYTMEGAQYGRQGANVFVMPQGGERRELRRTASNADELFNEVERPYSRNSNVFKKLEHTQNRNSFFSAMEDCVTDTANNQQYNVLTNHKDSDSGYKALEENRNTAYNSLLEHRNTYAAQLCPAIEQQLLDNKFIQYLNDNGFDNLSRLHRQYQDAMQNNRNVDTHRQALLNTATHDNVLRGYLAYDVKDKQVNGGYSHPQVLLALAHLRQVDLTLWQPSDNTQNIRPIDATNFNSQDRVNLLLLENGVLFNLEAKQATEQQTEEQTEVLRLE
jgi:hypothetical protein